MKNSINFQNLLLKDKESIWIGVDEEDDFTNHIPNFYEFKHNFRQQIQIELDFIRSEPRKNLKFLRNLDSVVFTSEGNLKKLIKNIQK